MRWTRLGSDGAARSRGHPTNAVDRATAFGRRTMVTTLEFAWRHRSKLVAGALIVTAGAVAHSPWRGSSLPASPPAQTGDAPGWNGSPRNRRADAARQKSGNYLLL